MLRPILYRHALHSTTSSSSSFTRRHGQPRVLVASVCSYFTYALNSHSTTLLSPGYFLYTIRIWCPLTSNPTMTKTGNIQCFRIAHRVTRVYNAMISYWRDFSSSCLPLSAAWLHFVGSGRVSMLVVLVWTTTISLTTTTWYPTQI